MTDDGFVKGGRITLEIKRIHSYKDQRFSDKVLLQHGCFLVDDIPYEVEIISDFEAIIRGAKRNGMSKSSRNFVSTHRILLASLMTAGM